jgi:hypothetical protein
MIRTETTNKNGRYWAVLGLAALLPMIASTVWYIVFGHAWLTLRGIDPDTADTTPAAWALVGQYVRNLVVVVVLASLMRRLEVTTVAEALRLGLLVWFGFEAMAIVGAVLHEDYPLGLYAIHTGDALLATLVVTLVLGTYSRRNVAGGSGQGEPR